ncbi:polysaccharide biosynthesis/export family protein, partial [bacterium]|nr:polysaccharide biosynthesis/export family protein [bacterium]
LMLETRIGLSGSLTYPLLGDVKVEGLTVAAAEKKIAGLLEAGGFLRKPQVNILVTQLQSQQISVLGQVNRPGRYPLDSKRSLLDTLAMAGGIAPDGADVVTLIAKRENQVRRIVVDVIDMVRSGDLNRDDTLIGGDVI